MASPSASKDTESPATATVSSPGYPIGTKPPKDFFSDPATEVRRGRVEGKPLHFIWQVERGSHMPETEVIDKERLRLH